MLTQTHDNFFSSRLSTENPIIDLKPTTPNFNLTHLKAFLYHAGSEALISLTTASIAIDLWNLFIGIDRVCPHKNDSYSEKMRIILLENLGFKLLWMITLIRYVPALTIKFCLYLHNKLTPLTDLIQSGERRLYSALVYFIALQWFKRDLPPNYVNLMNAMSVLCVFQFIQFMMEVAQYRKFDKRLYIYPETRYERIMNFIKRNFSKIKRGVDVFSTISVVLAWNKMMVDNVVNYFVNGPRDHNWEGKPVLIAALSAASFPTGALLELCVPQQTVKKVKSGFGISSLSLFFLTIMVSYYFCWNPTLIDYRAFAKNWGYLLLFLLASVAASIGHYIFTKPFSEEKERKTALESTDINDPFFHHPEAEKEPLTSSMYTTNFTTFQTLPAVKLVDDSEDYKFVT